MTNTNKRNYRTLTAYCNEESFILDYESVDSPLTYENDRLWQDFKADRARALLYFGFEPRSDRMPPLLAFMHEIAEQFIKSLSRNPDLEYTYGGSALEQERLTELLQAVPFALGVEHITPAWLERVWQELAAAFRNELALLGETATEFLHARDASLRIVGRVFFHLVESDWLDYPFAFLATYSTAGKTKDKAVHLPLKNALLEYRNQRKQLVQLLTTVSEAADRSEFIAGFMKSGELFSPLRLTADEAYTFLREVPLYEECGIVCRIPDWWKKKSHALRLSASVGDKPPSRLGLNALIHFSPHLMLGEESLSREEVERLLTEASGLRLIKGGWVEVDHQKLQAALAVLEQLEDRFEQGLTLVEMMQLQLGLKELPGLPGDSEPVEISNGEWLRNLRQRLLNPAPIAEVTVGENFRATLRPYQQSGLNWLYTMRRLGFGALLADDMGLGKTVQVIALLNYLCGQGKLRALIVVPASLLGNWQKEISRFAPALTYRVLHQKNTALGSEEKMLYLTTYGMVLKLDALQEQEWDVLILDEAQNIKNNATKQSKAVKKLDADCRIAMTGTPIENRLGELWSIFDFLNAGLLGTAKEFALFSKRLRDEGDYTRLRRVISPFILRRLKTDKSILPDLPDKIVIKEYIGLTPKQVVLYRQVLKELEKGLQNIKGIGRKGLVLATITKLKQICNHPDQYLGSPTYAPELSGKFARLTELCETIREKRERVLVFSQFREITEPLAHHLEGVFGRKGYVLHGGTPIKRRQEIVDSFNAADYVPFIALSLKAGGVGLNLTGANHVLHFDRWWNPAVENQATDRAFRIGQWKKVLVYTFITTGTLEEKIDAVIEDKQKLAGDILSASGEQVLTELDNEQLLSLLRLE